MAGELELADDLRPKERDDVGGDAETEAGHDLLGDRGAPEDVPALQDDGAQPGPRQVRRADEPVVAAPDDDRVVAGVRLHRGAMLVDRPATFAALAACLNSRLLARPVKAMALTGWRLQSASAICWVADRSRTSQGKALRLLLRPRSRQ